MMKEVFKRFIMTRKQKYEKELEGTEIECRQRENKRSS